MNLVVEYYLISLVVVGVLPPSPDLVVKLPTSHLLKVNYSWTDWM